MNHFTLAIGRSYYTALLLILIFVSEKAVAQAPVINSFTPESGYIGSIVNITGSNFGTNTLNNTVYFGAVKATIISVSPTKITVKVPNGATYKPITVTANALTAYSQKPFIVKFNSTPFNAGSFAGKVDFQTANVVSGLGLKDLDGDGQIDIVAVTSTSSALSIFKNNSHPTVAAFTTITKTIGGMYKVGVAIDDLDGDAKPDIVIANFGSKTIAIYKNTSANNQISFASPLTLATVSGSYSVAISDLDGDGRPDIAVTNEDAYPGVLSIFRNSTIANGPISFKQKKDFAAEYLSRGVSIGDLDLDHKPDIVIASQNSKVSILRNTSTPGNITFAPTIIYNMPFGSSSESVAISDFDGDLKPDLAVANNSGGTISVLKNNGSPGMISFSDGQEFFANTNPYSIAADDINGDGKPDIAVTNQTDNSVSVLINSSTSGSVNFNPKFDFPVGDYPRPIAIGDIDGDGRPDLVTGSRELNTISILLDNIIKLNSVITFPPPININIDADNILHPGATSTNTETPIIYTSSNPNVAYIGSDGAIHVIAPGITIITALQNGNNNYQAAIPVERTFTIKQNQQIVFAPFAQKYTCDADFNAGISSSNATIPIIYTSDNTAVATIDAHGLIHIIGTGVTTITAQQNGNNLYNDAIPRSEQLTVSLPVTPAVSIAPDLATACEGTPLNIIATVSNSAGATLSYQWKINGSSTGTNNPVLTVPSANRTDVFQCVVTNISSCMVKGTSNSLTDINILPYITPAIHITSSVNTPACSAAIIFTATTTNGGINPTYKWKVNGVNSGENSATFSTAALTNNDIITCELINNDSPCLSTLSSTSNAIVAQVITAGIFTPTVTITSSANNVYEGTTISFTAVAANTGAVFTYQWQVNGTNVGTNSNIYSSNELRNGDEVVCIIISNMACISPAISNVLTMALLPPITVNVTNTFTPNDDGINDYWTIPGLISFPDCQIHIYNRYGNLVYQSKGYGKPWDGRLNGKLLPSATYYYIIEPDSKSKRLSGHLTIIR